MALLTILEVDDKWKSKLGFFIGIINGSTRNLLMYLMAKAINGVWISRIKYAFCWTLVCLKYPFIENLKRIPPDDPKWIPYPYVKSKQRDNVLVIVATNSS